MTIAEFLAQPEVRRRLEKSGQHRSVLLSATLTSQEATLRHAVTLHRRRSAWALLAGFAALAGASSLHVIGPFSLLWPAAGLVFAYAAQQAFGAAARLGLCRRLAHSPGIVQAAAQASHDPLVLRYLTLARRQRGTWFEFDGVLCAALAGPSTRHFAERTLLEKTYP